MKGERQHENLTAEIRIFIGQGFWIRTCAVFDIIMYTEFGTTYNSYILKAGDETILFETAKEKFFGDYKAALSEQLDIAQIDYIVVDHTEPDHAGSIAHIIAENPQAKIIATPTAISFLKNIVRGFLQHSVKMEMS